MKKSVLKIHTLLSQIAEYALETPKNFSMLTAESIADIYNGAGPDWMPAWQRAILTEFLEIFEPVFVIHDIRFNFSDKTKRGFNTANNEMWRNMKRVLSAKFPLSNPLNWLSRAKWYTRAYIAYKACKDCGWKAWTNGKPRT